MIFDTDVLIWAARGSSSAARTIDAAADRALSLVSFMELVQGARSKVEIRQIQQSLATLGFSILPLSEGIGARAAALIEQYALAYGIQLADALIAATAIEAGQRLCTANSKHFRPIRGLSLVSFRHKGGGQPGKTG
jgi:predicted nucleic acid-binding protein